MTKVISGVFLFFAVINFVFVYYFIKNKEKNSSIDKEQNYYFQKSIAGGCFAVFVAILLWFA